MAIFHYIARDSQGQTVRGTVQAKSRLEASDYVRTQGYFLQEMTAEPEVATPINQMQQGVIKPLFGGVPTEALAIFFRQLATMLGAGVHIHQALHTLGNQRSNPRLRAIVLEIRDSIVSGEAIANSFDRYPEVFSPVQRALIRVGESGGLLENSLRQIAEYLEQELELRRLLRRVTLYPKILLVAAIVMPMVPKLVLGWLNVPGGAPTRQVVLDITWVFVQIFLILFAVWAVFRIGSQSRTFRLVWDTFKVSVPSIGFTLRQLALARFGRALGALYNAGLPFSQAVRVAADACGNEYLSSAIKPAANRVEAGTTITESFAGARVFPPMVLDMVATGENTGEIGTMLNKVAEYYEEEGKVRSQQAGVIFGAVVYLGIAIYIGILIIQFYSGYFTQILNSGGAGAP
jgi:type IV pilus assembly protein PilC